MVLVNMVDAPPLGGLCRQKSHSPIGCWWFITGGQLGRRRRELNVYVYMYVCACVYVWVLPMNGHITNRLQPTTVYTQKNRCTTYQIYMKKTWISLSIWKLFSYTNRNSRFYHIYLICCTAIFFSVYIYTHTKFCCFLSLVLGFRSNNG